jgi:hypothetical protein
VSPTRRISFAFGVLFLITFITSIPALLLFQPVLALHRDALAAGRGRRRRRDRLHARSAQGLDVHLGARLGRGLGKRAHPRLSDVPLWAGATTPRNVRARRRPADHPLGHPRDVRRRRPGRHAAGSRLATIPEFVWELGLGINATVWGFRSSSPILTRAATGPAL